MPKWIFQKTSGDQQGVRLIDFIVASDNTTFGKISYPFASFTFQQKRLEKKDLKQMYLKKN